MTSLFPLYSTINKNIPSKDLTIKQSKLLKTRIDAMDPTECEYVYMLICSYKLENETYSSYTIPYSGKFVGNDVVFDLASFPPKLKQILFKFSEIHTVNSESKQED